MFTLIFWKASFERAVSTSAQTLGTLAGMEALQWIHLDWAAIFIAAGIAGGLSIAKSLAVAGTTDGNPSVASVERLS